MVRRYFEIDKRSIQLLDRLAASFDGNHNQVLRYALQVCAGAQRRVSNWHQEPPKTKSKKNG
jgi:hypothetical protein